MTKRNKQDDPSENPLYFEDLSEGDRFSFGSRTVTREEILAFAEQYDPQWFHVDESAAQKSFFEGLVASGWHTVSVTNRMLIDDVFSNVAVMGGSGVDDLRWPKPVRPGDTLSGSVKIADRSTGRHDNRGYIELDVVANNQDSATVLSMTSTLLIKPAGESPGP